jgi:hypothetical protein
VPDKRVHRGPHPKDLALFAEPMWDRLRYSVADLSWLLTRGYAETSSLKIVGDRFALVDRQRMAVMRCACADQALAQRRARCVSADSLSGRPILIDGYNVLTTIEAALAGGIIVLARDGCLRDLASVHGSFRRVAETVPAIQTLGQFLAAASIAPVTWLLDQPVSNSGRLKRLILDHAALHHWAWHVELVSSPDAILRSTNETVATADSKVLDHCRAWVNVTRPIIAQSIAHARVVDLTPRSDPAIHHGTNDG